jgi:hypothetical protein
METVGIIALTAAKLVGVGACLGVGFWASKKATARLDAFLLLYDKREQERIAKETQEELAPAA